MEDNDDLDFVASEHDRLVSAITKLDKTQHITEPTRNESTNQNSEFNLIKRSSKLQFDNVVKVLEDTAHNVQIGKKLKKSQAVGKVLPKPLEKPEAERIKRATGYEETTKKIGRWDPVVARNRTVDFVSFPIQRFPSKVQQTGDFLSKLELKSPLQKELEEIDPPPESTEVEEEEQTYPMSYEEMLEHRQNAAKFRAQQSYKAAKAKRQSKIKSKKYHRILKKERLKQQLNEFEELQSKNPEEALKKLEELEKARALERHTLRHKSTGKWAKNKLVRAKYDKEVRQQLAEQLSVGRSLTHKTQDTQSTEDEADETENIPDLNLAQDPMNPWMMKSSDKSNVDADFDFGYKKYLKDKMYKRTEIDSDSDQEETNNEKANSSLRILKDSVKKIFDMNVPKVILNEEVKSDENIKNTVTISNAAEKSKYKTRSTKKVTNKIIATSDWVVEEFVASKINDDAAVEDISIAFDKFENKLVGKVEKKLKKLRKQISNINKQSKEVHNKEQNEIDDEQDNLEYFKFKNQNPKPQIDEELLETNKSVADIKEKELTLSHILSSIKKPSHENVNVDIDPNRFIEVKPKYLNTAVSKEENGLDDLDDNEEQVVPKVDIEEVFEEDDVVDSFRQEKEEEINKDTPQDIDLTLPGWGSWGGKGVKAPKRKKNRFIGKPAPKMPRRDKNKGDIIINEFQNPKLAVHKVSDLPFPFTSVKDYEASIRTPLGNTFIPETAHKKLIQPSVITKAGTVIEPMHEDELLVKKNRTFTNTSILKLPIG
ncbi:U3 small nucleolar RNA-associated protein 14 homolog A [Maniola hyperantus]|uniref:U3 small nucleolar RNA-associated protein 14 homolog A n=1 Tax=Aphantopus hyperantus TaxID=2795564 RepID=UPI00156A3173|nr:U3 small nucleolar RNA-associated protein 14 homolog A [Maniola hyperantus]